MKDVNLSEILAALNGNTIPINLPLDSVVAGISTDSRKILPGEIFVALIGEKMDGHDYLEAAESRGALLAIVSKKISSKIPIILVEDTLAALNQIAECYRKKYDIPVIGVTGSTGKTSTKELLASVLGTKFNVHKTQMNFNNEIGLPMTIFNLDPKHEVSILELGMNHEGEISRLAKVAKPLIGVITNIGTAHIENLLSQDNILSAKLEITTYFDEKSLLIVNGDDKYLKKIQKNNYDIKTVSLYNDGDYNATEIENRGEEGVTFNCNYRGKPCKFKLNVPGIHNIYNALYGIAVGDYFGLSEEELAKGIEAYRPVGQRMNMIHLENNIKVINDYYNANPDSMKAALNVLGDYKENRKIAVLGDMFELGTYSEEAHREIGEYAASKSDVLVAVGTAAIHYYNACKDKIEACFFDNKEEAGRYIAANLKAGDVVLIKASNGMKMGDIADYLINGREKV